MFGFNHCCQKQITNFSESIDDVGRKKKYNEVIIICSEAMKNV